MLFLIALILAFGFAFLCGKPLKKHPFIFYTTAVIITVASVILAGANTRSLPEFVNTYIIGLFTRGALATALWYVVMFMGALPNGSAPIKKLMPIRGELSIFTAILTLGHNIGFGQTYFVRLFTDAGRMSDNQKIAGILSIAMLVIMIPLTVMSFPAVRKKMNAKLWKKIQRTAYLFYAMIYIHVLVLYYPMAKAGREGIFFNILVYSVAFIGYAVMRIRKHIVIKMKPKNKTILNIISALAFLGAVSGVLVSCGADKPEDKSNSGSTHSISSATTTAVSAESTATTAPSDDTATTTTVQTVSETDTTTDISDTETETTDTATTETTTTTAENEESQPENSEESAEEPEENNQPEESQEETPEQPDEPETPPETEPSYVYKNGTYSASAYGYDGDVFVDITIENDVITSISARTEESDDWYFNSAQDSVISQILSSQNTDVDAYSGATYSSNAIMEAVQKALNSAKN
ncbi:MAG: FMN-binding protein [Ruminococcus flavefaciens]|nr:FMN-binding protein [Ruminococcus flavefaciens]